MTRYAFLSLCILALGAAASTAPVLAAGPDVTVYDLTGVSNFGAADGYRAYSVGTTSCNQGDEPLWWCDEPGGCGSGGDTAEWNEHPVIGQNVYRLKDGRMEQIGQGWLKHGFLALAISAPGCGDGSCDPPPFGGDQLGVGCTDPYGSGLNGSRPLGQRSEVNATTGAYPFPFTVVPTSTVYDQRIRVLETDVDPALNPGARYFVEGHYVTPDDAAAANDQNNASYREVTVSAGSFNLNLLGPTVRERAAIEAWGDVDPDVQLVEATTVARPIEVYHVARKVTFDGGLYHYEYAVHNLNSDRSGQAFSVSLPDGAAISNVGFKDVDSHSGEPYATTDWTSNVDVPSSTVSWFTDTFAVDANANALRWGTMYNFWFDADRPPSADFEHTITLFKPGVPSAIVFQMPEGNLVFADGFESGDFSAWTESSP